MKNFSIDYPPDTFKHDMAQYLQSLELTKPTQSERLCRLATWCVDEVGLQVGASYAIVGLCVNKRHGS